MMKKCLAMVRTFFTRLNVCTAIFSVFFAIAFEYGRILTNESGLANGGLNAFNVILLFFIAFFICRYLFIKLEGNVVLKRKRMCFSWKRFLIVLSIIFICFFIVFLAFYPGIFRYDVLLQLRVNTTHHPLLHTYFMRFFCKVIGGEILNNYNYGIALYTLAQAFILAAIFSYIIERLRIIHQNKIIYVISILFCSIIPFNLIMAISATKDTLFAGFLLLSIVFFFDILTSGKDITWKKAIPFMVVFTITILLRNNMPYVAICWVPIILLILRKKRLCLYSIISIVVSIIFTISVSFITKSVSGSRIEMLSIPIQTLAKIAIDNPEVVDDYVNKKILSMEKDEFISEVSNKYNKLLVDPIKHIVKLENTGENFFIRTWLSYCLKYPIETVDAWSRLTVSSWYLFNTDYVNVYQSEEGRGYLETGFDKVWDKTGMNSKIPVLNSYINNQIRNGNYRNNLLLYVIMAPALYMWIIIFLFFYSIYCRKYYITSITTLILLLFATILLGPCVIIRYMYPIMLSCPVILLYAIYWREKST